MIPFNPKSRYIRNGRIYSWKSFYLREVYAINKLKEDFDIPYVSSQYYFDPYTFYTDYKDREYIYEKAISYAIMVRKLDLVKHLTETASKRGYKINLNEILLDAAYWGEKDIVDYLIEQGADDFQGARSAAIDGEQEDMYDYLKTYLQ